MEPHTATIESALSHGSVVYAFALFVASDARPGQPAGAIGGASALPRRFPHRVVTVAG